LALFFPIHSLLLTGNTFSSGAALLTVIVDKYKAATAAQNEQTDYVAEYPAEYDKTHPNDPFDLSAVEKATTDLTAANQALSEAQDEYEKSTMALASANATLATLKAKRDAYKADLDLIKFQGYANATIKLTSTTAGASAAFVGTTPDGQSWTYSSKLRVLDASATSASLLFNTTASKAFVDGQLSVVFPATDTDAATLNADGDGDGINWNWLPLAGVGPKPPHHRFQRCQCLRQ